MAEENAKQKSSKTVVILLLIIIVLLLAGIALAVMYFIKDKDGGGEETVTQNTGIVQYEQNGIVALDEDNLRELMEDLQNKAGNNISLKYQTGAYSTDGTHFSCYIGNSGANEYDMYAAIYIDKDLTEQVLLTGLIPPGSGIEEFDSEIALEPGTYEAVLVLTQVEDDHSTIHAQTMVTLDLNVGQ